MNTVIAAGQPSRRRRILTQDAAPTWAWRQSSGAVRRRRGALGIMLAIALISLGMGASSASAQFISNTSVPAGWIYSSTAVDAHTTDEVYGNSDHTWCPAMTQGARGWDQSVSYLSYGACGPGFQDTIFCNCIYTRGAVYNPNQLTSDYIYYAYWVW